MVVPLLGATAVGGTVVHDRYEVRSASLALRSRAADLALQTQLCQSRLDVAGVAAMYW